MNTDELGLEIDVGGEEMAKMNLVRHLREQSHLTQKELAELCQVSYQVVLRTEQFLYKELNICLARALPELSGYDISPGSLQSVYKRQKNHHIREFGRWLTEATDYRTVVSRSLAYAEEHYDSKRSPVEIFRVHVFEHYGFPGSRIKFCTSTGMHPYILSDLEHGKITWEQAKSFREVLNNVLDLPYSQIRNLGIMQDAYYLTSGGDY